MKKLKYIFTILAMATSSCSSAQYYPSGEAEYFADLAIIPEPVNSVPHDAYFLIDGRVAVSSNNSESDSYAQYLQQYLSSFLITDESSDRRINLIIDHDSGLPEEGYAIKMTAHQIDITGADTAGLFYGITTLLQLMPAYVYETGSDTGPRIPVNIRCYDIEDHPRYSYRGFSLDCARAYIPTEDIFRVIDLMAHHKLNKLHWHLTDDEAWRLEIPDLPLLTAQGAYRGPDLALRPTYGKWCENYGGYYSVDDVAQIIEYAAFRNIEVIPEIDMPGHSMAIAAAYPEILCDNHPPLSDADASERNVWCAARHENFDLTDRILAYVAKVFPSGYVHIGGDEVDEKQWTVCSRCKEKFGKMTTTQINAYFLERVSDILLSHGKLPVVWNEAVETGVFTKEAIVSAWENSVKCEEVANKGYRTILMPAQFFYYDMKQSAADPGLRWAGIVTLEKTYRFDESQLNIRNENRGNIMGVEGAFWGENFLSQEENYLQTQLFPRMCALSETAWSQNQRKDWNNFTDKLFQYHLQRLDALQMPYRIDPPIVKYEEGVISAIHYEYQIEYRISGPEGIDGPNYYRAPVITSEPQRYEFRTVRGLGRSAWTSPENSERLRRKPSYVMQSTLKALPSYPYSNASDYNDSTNARTMAPCRAGDSFVWTFDRATQCSSITIRTGNLGLPKQGIPCGYVEVSYDGVSYELLESSFSMKGTVYPAAPVKKLRLTCTTDGKLSENVIIHDLIIY